MTLAVRERVSLQSYNTLAIAAQCGYLIEVSELEQLPQALDFARRHQLPRLILGGGSNIVLADDFPGVVIHMVLRGINVDVQGDTVLLDIAAGENWHDLVCWCLQQGYYGLENLALIPGTVGAAPIQNIGAYGVELQHLLDSVTGWDCEQESWQTLTNTQCEFGYRDSVFKHALKDRFIITSVRLRLSLKANTRLNYQILSDYLAERQITTPTPEQVADAVIAIRQSKLPDPATLPNAGSFFKNPVISVAAFERLQQQFPSLVYYPQADGRFKLAAGWLVEQTGWKGRSLGQVGVHEQQALVLINPGQGTGQDILQLASAIQQDVYEQFAIELEIEPRVYSYQQT